MSVCLCVLIHAHTHLSLLNQVENLMRADSLPRFNNSELWQEFRLAFRVTWGYVSTGLDAYLGK